MAASGLGERHVDERLELGQESVVEIRLETEAPIDDLLVMTSAPGRLFFQVKTNLSLAKAKSGEMAKTVGQFVRQWRLCSEAKRTNGWDYPLDKNCDRLVIAVGPETPGTVAIHLGKALLRRREGAKPSKTPQAQKDALHDFTVLLKAAWKNIYKTAAAKHDIDDILDLIVVLKLDFHGADLELGREFLRGSLVQPQTVKSSFKSLAIECQDRMVRSTGFTVMEIRRVLERGGIRLLAPEDYRKDIAAIQKKSLEAQENLSLSTMLKTDDGSLIPIPREVSKVAKAAATEGSFLLIGEPGAGKTGVLTDLAKQLASDGHEIVVFSVDKPGSGGLKDDLGLSHSVREVLENWPGPAPAYLLIDGLDAARGGSSEADYRNLIGTVLKLPGDRWRVIASVRSFDLRAGQQYRALFNGTPPNADFAVTGTDLANVRHVDVRQWSESEFEQLLKKAPKLRKAIDAGGSRLREIALVPFNTQLLADVVGLGVQDAELGSIRNQTELLRFYWQRRVGSFGAEGRACLTSALTAMEKEHSLEADSGPLELAHAGTFDGLQQAGILVSRRNGRLITFRHNILFDYAASRLYLDPFKPEKLKEKSLRNRGVGLLLGPALQYALQELWEDESEQPDHNIFWDLVLLMSGDRSIDPMFRSIIAQRACELTGSVADIRQLANKITDTRASSEVLSSIAGALTILLEDNPEKVDSAPWAFLIEKVSTMGSLSAPVGYLVEKLLKANITTESFRAIGKAARNLLERGFSAADSEANRNFVRFSVASVASTYASDPQASSTLLERVFDKNRLKKFAYLEVPMVALKIATIAKVDSDFAVYLYGQIFAHHVDSQKQKLLSGGRILPMSGSESDVYGTAKYALVQHFADFLKDDPKAAMEALIGVMEGYVSTTHPKAKNVKQRTLVIGNATIQFAEDGSFGWVWEIDTTHPESTGMIFQQHIAKLRQADKEEAEKIVSVLFEKNRLAILWARLLMVATERPEVYSELLWDLATNEQILLSLDTRKDAIDAIAAFYPLRTVAEKQTFEENALLHGSADSGYQSVRRRSLETLFQTIGEQNLVTEQAREFAVPAPNVPLAVNARPFSISGGVMPYGLSERLLDSGVDLEAPQHSGLFALAQQVNESLELSTGLGQGIKDVSHAASELRQLAEAIRDAEHAQAHENVLRTSRDVLSNGTRAVLDFAQRTKAEIPDEALATLREIALSLSQSTDSKSGPMLRANAVTQLFILCQQSGADAAVKRVAALASDPEPSVRQAITRDLATLLNFFPAKMWKLAEGFIQHEQDPLVLGQLVAAFLAGLRNVDPKRIESMSLKIQDRFPYQLVNKGKDSRAPLWKHSAKVMAGLYVWNDRKKSGDRLFDWAASPQIYEDQIRNALYEVRKAVCQGYDACTPELQAARQRIQRLLGAVVQHSAAALEQHYSLGATSQKAKLGDGRRYAKCLEYACMSLYFGSGAFHERNPGHDSPILTDAGKQRYVNDVQQMLRRLGDISIPSTIYQLVKLLDFLLPGEPALCFDLFTHALRESGRKHGFQGEQLGVDVLVRIVSRSLADFDYIFLNKTRREDLVTCLDIFIDAGWPAALRLLYRLPDSFR
ncbi:hypothetical protein [Edaphobacter modestus]|uniref:hypothetical protein n=1 Tax=Edaphobacter modestus TaxID=388466 RepID=UPI0013EECEE3|nr:hypothetical protein [Edaphobacter modestus]